MRVSVCVCVCACLFVCVCLLVVVCLQVQNLATVFRVGAVGQTYHSSQYLTWPKHDKMHWLGVSTLYSLAFRDERIREMSQQP